MPKHHSSSISTQLARFVTQLELKNIPAPVQEKALQLILDGTGIAYACLLYTSDAADE